MLYSNAPWGACVITATILFLQLQELQASALRKSIDKEPTPSPDPQALQLTPTTNGELNAKAHSLLCLMHQIVAHSTQRSTRRACSWLYTCSMGKQSFVKPYVH